MLIRRAVSSGRRRTPLLDFNFTTGSLPGNNSVTRSTDATRINSSGLVETVSANTARMNYSSVNLGARGLLLEEARTNLLPYSNDFSNAAWTKTNGTVATSGTASPTGATNAQTFTASGPAGDCYFYRDALTVPSPGATHTFSVYAKRGNVDYLSLIANTTPGGLLQVWFNLANGTVGTQALHLFARMDALPNGWYRCSVTFLAATGNFYCRPTLRTNGVFNTTVAGDFTYIYGAQLEQGGQASSFITTAATAVQRTADSLTTTVANGTYDILIKTHGGGEWRNGVTVSGGTYTLTPRAGAPINLQALEFKTAGAWTQAQKDTALEDTSGALVWAAVFETDSAGVWNSAYNSWHEWSTIQGLDPAQGPGATHCFVASASSLGITAKEGTRVAQFRRPDVNDNRPHAKCYKEWRHNGFSKTDDFSRSEEILSNNGDTSGIYSVWVWYPASASINIGDPWSSLFQWKEQGIWSSTWQQIPNWWLNMSSIGEWSFNGLPAGNTDPMIFVNHWNMNWSNEPQPGTGRPYFIVPKGRWFEVRAELYERDRIDWYLDGKYFDTSLHSIYPVGRFADTYESWITGIGYYDGQGTLWFDKYNFRRLPT